MKLGYFVSVGAIMALVVGTVAYRRKRSAVAMLAGLAAGVTTSLFLAGFRPLPGWVGIIVLPVVVGADVMLAAVQASRLVVALRLGVLTGLSVLAVRWGSMFVAGVLDNGPEDEVAYAILFIALFFGLGTIGLVLCLRYLSNLLEPAPSRALRVFIIVLVWAALLTLIYIFGETPWFPPGAMLLILGIIGLVACLRGLDVTLDSRSGWKLRVALIPLGLVLFLLMAAMLEWIPVRSQFVRTSYGSGRRDFEEFRLASGRLRGANLRGANLRGANLSRADLREADLSDADLSDADLVGAYLSEAVLTGAGLSRADLGGAELYDTDLSGADLCDADLRGAELYQTNLAGADMQGADLREAYLRKVDLTRTNLTGATVTDQQLAQAGSLAGATMPDGSVHK